MTSFQAPITFEMTETVRKVVEKCVLSTGNKLINISKIVFKIIDYDTRKV